VSDTILLAAGGTGGHLFPAQALAQELKSRGWAVHLATDTRGTRYADAFPGEAVHVVPSATFGSKNPIAMAKSAWTLWQGLRAGGRLVQAIAPKAAVGFGGYPSLPPMFAANRSGVALVLHEQNAVLGRANKLLSGKAAAVAAGFPSDKLPAGTTITGNPLRAEILDILAQGAAYAPSAGDAPFHLVVIGGSQGAQFFGDTIPASVAALPEGFRRRLRLTLQARDEQVDGAKAILDEAGITCVVAPFFDRMGERLSSATLMICRAGASTVSEVAAMGVPSVLVPYPFALDHDQAANAAELVANGGGIVAPQSTLDRAKLTGLIAAAMQEPERLAAQSAAARASAKPRATHDLADLVEKVAKGG